MTGQRPRPGARLLLRILLAAIAALVVALASGVLPVVAQDTVPTATTPAPEPAQEETLGEDPVTWGAPEEDPVEWGAVEEPAPKAKPPAQAQLREDVPEATTPEPKPAPKRSCTGEAWRPSGTDAPDCPKPPATQSPQANPQPQVQPQVGSQTFAEMLPGPSAVNGVPNFIIRKFRVPPFLLPIYQAAGIEYGIRWEILAAINEIETDYGRNLNVSSAGALGWMQFMPATWKAYGTDANKDSQKDPYNPVDAIFAAARYLKAAGYTDDVRQAIWAYNHADWYVDSVLLRARLIAGVPADLIGSLTGLTEGRFPIYGRARYTNAKAPHSLIRTRVGAAAVAVNDAVVKKIGEDSIVVQDAYGNRYAYKGLDSVAQVYPVPRGEDDGRSAKALRANPDPRPKAPASAGRQRRAAIDRPEPAPQPQPHAAVKERLFANPSMPQARKAGGMEQMLDAKALGGKVAVFRNYFSRPYGLDPSKVKMRPLKPGAQVIGGTILGRTDGTLRFEVRPAGRRTPTVNPKPILDGWRLLEQTAMRRRAGMSIGQILLLPKVALERRVLADERIDLYEGGRDDVRSGQVDRRVLATLEYLAESGLEPTVTSLRTGHSFLTASGNVSEHSSGNAVDIAVVNDIPIVGNQEPGGITDQTVRELMLLQGTMRPHQIISLLDYGQNTLAMADHADHIHVGFQPLYGGASTRARAVLKPAQWSDLIARLGQIENPVVPTDP